ncbi:MAG: SIMPL domain-containing protein [Phycisphaerales bacterium]
MERIRFGTGMLLLGATLAFGTIASAQAIAKALVAMRQQEGGIRVKGYAAEDITSDQGSWSGAVTVRAATLKDAYARLETDVAKLRAFVKSAGFGDELVSTSAIRSEEIAKLDERGARTNVIEAYRLVQSTSVTSPNPQAIAKLARDATSLIKDGVDISSGQPVFIHTGIEAIKLRLLGAATDNGRARADTLAKGAGGRTGRLVGATQGVFQIVPKDSTDVNDYGAYDTTTIQKTVKAVVTLDFAVER